MSDIFEKDYTRREAINLGLELLAAAGFGSLFGCTAKQVGVPHVKAIPQDSNYAQSENDVQSDMVVKGWSVNLYPGVGEVGNGGTITYVVATNDRGEKVVMCDERGGNSVIVRRYSPEGILEGQYRTHGSNKQKPVAARFTMGFIDNQSLRNGDPLIGKINDIADPLLPVWDMAVQAKQHIALPGEGLKADTVMNASIAKYSDKYHITRLDVMENGRQVTIALRDPAVDATIALSIPLRRYENVLDFNNVFNVVEGQLFQLTRNGQPLYGKTPPHEVGERAASIAAAMGKDLFLLSQATGRPIVMQNIPGDIEPLSFFFSKNTPNDKKISNTNKKIKGHKIKAKGLNNH